MSARWLAFAAAIVAAAWLFAPTPAQAACNPLSFCSCEVSADPMSFGAYDPFAGGAAEVAGEVRVRCTLLAALAGSFTVDLSTGSSNSYSGRSLRMGGSTLTYNLYTTAARTQIWGDGTGGSVRMPQSFTALLLVNRTLPVYGRIPAGQNVPAGTYSDTIVVTVVY